MEGQVHSHLTDQRFNQKQKLIEMELNLVEGLEVEVQEQYIEVQEQEVKVQKL